MARLGASNKSAITKAITRKPTKPFCKFNTRKPAAQSATQAIHEASGLTQVINNADSCGNKGEINAAIKPVIVIGATAGAANKFAKRDAGDRKPESATITGAQKTIAAIGGAAACAKKLGNTRAKNSVTRGAKRSNPAVASTDSANPGSRDCQGSPTTTSAMAKPSAGSESTPRLVP